MVNHRFAAPAVDRVARLLIRAADTVAARSRVPNPMAATRVVLANLADQNLSGADFYGEITNMLDKLGFTWPDGLCHQCHEPLTDEQAEAGGLCRACDPWVCACAFANPAGQCSAEAVT
ncbi:hypothetical protein [Streptomyces luteireticuli]|uniref:hypothetical protein n=1 Tax=Streptomyces luteireticuli TaxID=173858 RepID=UPI003557E6F4